MEVTGAENEAKVEERSEGKAQEELVSFVLEGFKTRGCEKIYHTPNAVNTRFYGKEIIHTLEDRLHCE
jgi:hypothetical protein